MSSTDSTQKSKKALTLILVILALLVIIAIIVVVVKSKKNPTPNPNPGPNPPNPQNLPPCPSGWGCSKVGDQCIDTKNTVWYCDAGARKFADGESCAGPCWNTTPPALSSEFDNNQLPGLTTFSSDSNTIPSLMTDAQSSTGYYY